MKTLTRTMLIMIAAVALLAGCAKPPETELAAAKASIDKAVAAGAETYCTQEIGKVKSDLSAAQKEIATQQEKFWKNFDNAKAMLIKVDADAKAAEALVAPRKEEAKQAAIAAEGEAKAALEEAKALLAKAPKGKGTRADIEAFKADLKGIEDSLPEIATLIASEQYFPAKEKADALKAKAADISAQITAAMEKTKK
jgi:putative hemolysin